MQLCAELNWGEGGGFEGVGGCYPHTISSVTTIYQGQPRRGASQANKAVIQAASLWISRTVRDHGKSIRPFLNKNKLRNRFNSSPDVESDSVICYSDKSFELEQFPGIKQEVKYWTDKPEDLWTYEASQMTKMKTRVDPLMFTSVLKMQNDQSRRGVRFSDKSRNHCLHVISACAHVWFQTIMTYPKSHVNIENSYDILGNYTP